MKTIKSLVLGSAAGLLAMGGAQAADLPVKAKAVEYVRVCSLYGAGFFYIPGTDTCIKLGGYLRVDTSFNTAGVQDQPAWSGDPGQMNRYRDYFSTRSRLALTVDTRTATEYGVVRTFGQADFQFDTLGGATFDNLSTQLGNNGNLLNSAGGGYTAAQDRMPTLACILRISSATSVSIRLGVCSRFQPRRMRLMLPTTFSVQVALRLRRRRSAATLIPSGAVR